MQTGKVQTLVCSDIGRISNPIAHKLIMGKQVSVAGPANAASKYVGMRLLKWARKGFDRVLRVQSTQTRQVSNFQTNQIATQTCLRGWLPKSSLATKQ